MAAVSAELFCGHSEPAEGHVVLSNSVPAAQRAPGPCPQLTAAMPLCPFLRAAVMGSNAVFLGLFSSWVW